ncbi:MAG: acyl-CoA dehydrogenase family protein [Acidimicrobiia bacterium]|nr:acyl-CoA dehydrogenase family protein [Acidimicrobiia bacterium]
MRFELTEDQQLFAATVRELLEKTCSPEKLREAWDDEESPLVGRPVVGAGRDGRDRSDGLRVPRWPGDGRPRPRGDPRGDRAGRAARAARRHRSPLTRLAAARRDRRRGRRPVAAGIAGGRAAVRGRARRQVAASVVHADAILVVDGVAPSCCCTGRVQRTVPQRSVDGAARQFLLQPDLRYEPRPDVGPALRRARDRGATATASQLVGLADRMLEMTVAYVTERQQFGQPIGGFQAIKHHLADALLAVEFARPVVRRAAHSLAHDDEHASRDASMAKVYASEGRGIVGRTACVASAWRRRLHGRVPTCTSTSSGRGR